MKQRGIILRGGSSILGTSSNALVSSSSSSSETSASSTTDGNGSHGNSSGGNLQNSKMQYIKQMVFQYLVCKDPEVKLHVESALMNMFRFSDAEKTAIDDTRKAESDDTLTTISSFLGLNVSS